MRILVTGGAGKLGQWVVAGLAAATADGGPGHEVVVLDRQPGEPMAGVRYVSGDVRDLGGVLSTAAGAEAIVHLAAIRRWGIAPNDETFRTNVLGTFNVHEAAAILGISRVVSTSSIAVLGWDYRERDFAPAYLPVDEAHPLRPQDAYGLSKLVGEQIARSHTDRTGLTTIALRPPWIATPDELAAVRAEGGRRADRFDTFAYVDVRDLVAAYRRAVEVVFEGHAVAFVAAADSTLARPLAEVLPELLPGSGPSAAVLQGTRSLISSDFAGRLLGWVPQFGWRAA